jgi:hypothetical protein
MPEILKVEPTQTGYRVRLSCGHAEDVEATKAGSKPVALSEELTHTKPTWTCRTCTRKGT